MLNKTTVLLWLNAMALAACAIMIGSTRWIKVRQECVVSDKIRKPFRVLLFSDLHGNNPRKMNLDIWKKIDEIKGVDIVVIAGDMITSSVDELVPHLDNIERLAKRMPVFYADGNHDRRSYRIIKRLFTERGVHVLGNRKMSLFINGNDVDIVGLRDYMYLKKIAGYKQADDVMMQLTPDRFNICVAHQPQVFERYSMYLADLFLCGHTHGGQVRLPFMPVLFAPNQGILPRFGYGWYSQDGAKMFITKGIGTTHFPIRFWNRPEICVIDILPWA